MSVTYRAAIRIGLPHATVVVDHFHVVQLANKMLSMVRRRATAESRGRRGRASDPAALFDTGHSNAKSEGINRVIKLVRPQRIRLPQPCQPTPTHTLRHHPPSPRTPPHRSTLKTHHSRQRFNDPGGFEHYVKDVDPNALEYYVDGVINDGGTVFTFKEGKTYIDEFQQYGKVPARAQHP
ncbi:transposase [Streptomyces pristinaespiralis]|uniref:Transposase n=2 Tax=Streptomyces pristinaespiralis TaxID=38300 RepID=A0A0M4D9C8_STRPR|nr:transposase [Streptomyces pristinaespiralis]